MLRGETSPWQTTQVAAAQVILRPFPRLLPPLESTQPLLVTRKCNHGTWPPRVTTTARRSVTMTTLDQPSEPTRGGEASHYFLPRATHNHALRNLVALAPPGRSHTLLPACSSRRRAWASCAGNARCQFRGVLPCRTTDSTQVGHPTHHLFPCQLSRGRARGTRR